MILIFSGNVLIRCIFSYIPVAVAGAHLVSLPHEASAQELGLRLNIDILLPD